MKDEGKQKTYWMNLPGTKHAADESPAHDHDQDHDRHHPDASHEAITGPMVLRPENEPKNHVAAPGKIPGRMSRRSFLKSAGFSFAFSAVSFTGLAKVRNGAIPFLIQPDDIIPGQAYYYQSTCGACSAGCGLMVKTRDGRPIKLEGNPRHSLSKGALCPIGQASILGLYDSKRLSTPLMDGKETTWDALDAEIIKRLSVIKKDGGAVRFITNSIVSPTLQAQLKAFLQPFPDAKVIVFDPLSGSAISDAHEKTHGARFLPHYQFEKAEVVVSFDADFLGTWISPVEFAFGYQAARSLETGPSNSLGFSYHVQFEPSLTITGSKADKRFRVAPEEMGLLLSHVAARLAKLAALSLPGDKLLDASVSPAELDDLAAKLWNARGKSLVISGSQDIQAQVLINFINHVLDNYGSTLDLEHPSYQRQGDDKALQALLEEMAQGKVAALFIAGLNPVYELPDPTAFANALAKIPLSVCISENLDETAEKARFVCPPHHYLESWSDAQPTRRVVSLFQPALQPLGNTRPLLESLTTWQEAPRAAYDLLREYWLKELYPKQNRLSGFQLFWDQSVHDGGGELDLETVPVKPFEQSAVQLISSKEPASGYTLVLYPKVGILAGQHASNPWLHELPDPISKNTWDNYLCVAPSTAAKLQVKTGDVMTLAVKGEDSSVELPIQVQPGLHESVIAVALGYGRKGTDRFRNIGPQWIQAAPSVGDNNLVGKSVSQFLKFADGSLRFSRNGASLTATGKKKPLACTQMHHSLTVPENLRFSGLEKREIILELSLAAAVAAAKKDQALVAAAARIATENQALAAGSKGVATKSASIASATIQEAEDLWPADHPKTSYHWIMAIDLSKCTGCSACVIACQVENNIPVVGRDEVLREREMHWMRIDRYYAGDGDDVDVAFQPMLCHHCSNAPCEVVCPVLATVHSKEGLNQQVYNRCVGTRYCANNCPYKVRRFNWFNYNREDPKHNLVLNPDITVRSRGVMEKCSFCVQRIQEAKIQAKSKGVRIADGEVRPACQQTCPSGAIVFGNANDPTGKIAGIFKNSRRFQVLGELNVKPSVNYLKIVRNRPQTEVEKSG